jgi:hypothetical protein
MPRRNNYGDPRVGRQVGQLMWRREPTGIWTVDLKDKEFSISPDLDVKIEHSLIAELLPVRSGRGGNSGPVSWSLHIGNHDRTGSWPVHGLNRAMAEALREIHRISATIGRRI